MRKYRLVRYTSNLFERDDRNSINDTDVAPKRQLIQNTIIAPRKMPLYINRLRFQTTSLEVRSLYDITSKTQKKRGERECLRG